MAFINNSLTSYVDKKFFLFLGLLMVREVQAHSEDLSQIISQDVSL